MRDGAQRAHNASRPQRIGNGLLRAVALADCKIGDGTGLIAANLEGNDDKIGALQGGFPVAVAADFAVRAHGIHQLAHHDMRLFQPGFIDIHQRDMRRFQRRALENITENILTNTVEPAPIKVILGQTSRTLHQVIEHLQSGTPPRCAALFPPEHSRKLRSAIKRHKI